MSQGASQSETVGTHEMDLVDLAAILIRRSVVIVVACVACLAIAVTLHLRPSVGMSTIGGVVQLGTVPAPRVVKQGDITMSMVLFDSPLTVLEPVVTGSAAKFFADHVAVPLAMFRGIDASSSLAAEDAFSVKVAEQGSIVSLEVTVPSRDEEIAVEVVDMAMGELVEHCRSKEAVQALWLESIISAQPRTSMGEQLGASLRAMGASVERTRVIGPAIAKKASIDRYSLPLLLVAGALVGLAIGVVAALVMELFARGLARTRRLDA